MPEQYRSKERVWKYDDAGAIVGIEYHAGDLIPFDEAVRQGLAAPATKKVSETSVEDKAVKQTATKRETSKE